MIFFFFYRYRFANFIFLVIGCCCIYSLLNVTSIVIKQGLNYVIQKLCLAREKSIPQLSERKPSISSIYKRKSRVANRYSIKPEEDISGSESRRMSGELISMKDFLNANKVTLAVMQKQLYETAQMTRTSQPIHHSVFKSSNAVGPLAIASEKFESSNR